MYEMKIKTPVMTNGSMVMPDGGQTSKRRSWTGRLKDRFSKSQLVRPSPMLEAAEMPIDDWTWASHPHLEGHHAPSVPSLQGSVFVAANFVYDYRQKYGFEPPQLHPATAGPMAPGWMKSTALTRGHTGLVNGGKPVENAAAEWSSGKDNTSPVLYRMLQHRMDDMDDEEHHVEEPAGRRSHRTSQFKAADVNHNIRQIRQLQQRRTTPSLAFQSTSGKCRAKPMDADEEEPPQTTVAVDRPGLVVSGERICILTGENPQLTSSSSSSGEEKLGKVSLRVEFQRNGALRRSLSDRAAPKMAPVIRFQDTTRLTVKSRSRGSLHDLFHATEAVSETAPPLPTSRPPFVIVQSPPTRRTISRPVDPPPPPPTEAPPPLPTSPPPSLGNIPADEEASEEKAPVAPPRRIYRHSKSNPEQYGTPNNAAVVNDEDRMAPLSSHNEPSSSEAVSVPAVNLRSPDVSSSSWSSSSKPLLSGHMVSWAAWAGHSSGTGATAPVSPYAVIPYHHQNDYPSPPSCRPVVVACRSNSRNSNSSNSSSINNDHVHHKRPPPTVSETKRTTRRPVSRLWPSFSSIGRSNQQPNNNRNARSSSRPPPEEHIYEEIDDKHLHRQPEQPQPSVTNGITGFSRTGRGGSFAGATRQDILRYLDELRKKHPTGIVDAETIRHNNKPTITASSPCSPPQWIPGTTVVVTTATTTTTAPSPSSPEEAEDEEDAQMGALLLAMRHNAVTRTSNRSTQSSSTATSTQSGSQDSAVSAGSSNPTAAVTLSAGCYQAIGGGGGGDVLERNDSGVGSETSGNSTAQRRLRRLRRLKQQPSTPLHQDDDDDDDEEEENNPAQVIKAIMEVDAVPTTPCWCVDCDQPITSESSSANEMDDVTHSGADVCHRCARRRCERREVLAELLETEVRYGRDLRVLQDELYKPLLVAGLVPLRQLDAVFLNVSELSGHSTKFGQRLREAVEIALEQGDEDLLTVDVARLFLDSETEEMMDAFRRYCVRSGEASLLLSSLEKERELLRIFLKASQLENPALRRMDLHAFLMVPVQRITKYPLLLGRLLRATAQQDVEMREALREAQAKVESYLTAINAEAKELGNCSSVSRPWRRGYSVPNLNLSLNNMMNSNNNNNGTGGTNGSAITGNNVNGHVQQQQQQQQQPARPTAQELMTLRLRKLAMDSLGWADTPGTTTRFVLDGQVKLTQPSDLLLTGTRSRGRTLKWQNIWLVLVTLHQSPSPDQQLSALPNFLESSGRLNFGLKCNSAGVLQEAALILMKDAKSPRPGPSLYREPLMLSQCTVSCEAELPNFFEIHHIGTKESFICQASDGRQAQQFVQPLRTLSLSLGQWRKRRNALPHVMMIS